MGEALAFEPVVNAALALMAKAAKRAGIGNEVRSPLESALPTPAKQAKLLDWLDVRL